MKKRTIPALLGLVFMMSVSAQEVSVLRYDDPNGLSYEYRKFSLALNEYLGYCVVSPSTESGNQDNYKGDVVIPDSITINNVKYEVRAIADNAFRDNTELTSITISNSIIGIGSFAFYGCTNLKSIELPSSIKTIEVGAFAGCTSMTTVSLNEGLRDLQTRNDIGTFEGCINLKSIKIPSTVHMIYINPFVNCNNLEQIVVDPDNPWYNSRNNCNAIISKNILISGCKNTVIPSGVTVITENAFSGSDLTTLDIPDGLIQIRSNAFYNCSLLDSINISSTVAFIEPGAFSNCSNLSSINVNPNNSYYDSRENCNAIIESIDYNLTYESLSGFSRQYSLVKDQIVLGCKNTLIPQSVTSIYTYSFWGCKNLQAITIPANITSIGVGAFIGCTGMTSMSVDPDNPVYDSRDNCNAIIETQTNRIIAGCVNTIIPVTVTSLAQAVFRELTNLTSMEIPNGVNYISSQLFYGCTNLKSVVIPSSVISIEQSAFMNCSSLLSIDLPSSLRTIYQQAFEGCSSLTSLTVHSEEPSIRIMGRVFNDSVYEHCTLFIPQSENYYETFRTYRLYRSNSFWGRFKNIKMPENIDCITINGINYDIISTEDKTVSVDYGYYQGEMVIPSKVTIDNIEYSVQKIGYGAFICCKDVTSVTLPEGLDEIQSEAFVDCSGLISINIPESVKTIGYASFSGCNNIASLTLPEGLEEIGADAFLNCSTLSSINIPSKVKYIWEKTFYGCKKLTSLILPEGLMEIGTSAFEGCSSLTSLIIPDGVKVLGSGFLRGCNNIASIDIPSSVDSIGTYAFYGCESLKSLIIPEGVTYIDFSFKGCKSLSYLSLPSTATFYDLYWDLNPLGDCDALQTAGPKGGGYNFEFCWDTIPANIFSGMKNLKSVYIPKTVKAIYDSKVTDEKGYGLVFPNCDNLESVAVSFSETRMIRFYQNPHTGISRSYESAVDNNLYRKNPVHTITLLDDNIESLIDIISDSIKHVIISEFVKTIDPYDFEFYPTVEDIIVENGNPEYSSVNGILFSKDGTDLLICPRSRQGGYKVPRNVIAISDFAFRNCSQLEFISIPKGVNIIGERAFEGCLSLDSVFIEGSPEIRYYAFWNCPNIKSVTTRSEVPGLMNIHEVPQTIIIGGYEDIDRNILNVIPVYNEELGRTITHIKAQNGDPYSFWCCETKNKYVPAGLYRVSIGLLPNPDSLPNYIHPVINGERNGINDIIYNKFTESRRPVPVYIGHEDPLIYNSILIVDSLEITDEYNGISFSLESGINSSNYHIYSSTIVLDRIFLEPLGKQLPIEYAGPFSESVFNNATLYVPDGAVNDYQTAEGWKLFKNIAVDTNTYPLDEIEINVTDAGFATFYYSDADYMLPQGLSAMVVNNISADGRLVYKTIASGEESGVIPAGVAVILASDNKKAGVFKLTLSDLHSEYNEYNLLMGSDVDTQTYANSNCLFYKLSFGPSGTDLKDVIGWYWGTNDGRAFHIEAHKAWLAIPIGQTKGTVGFSIIGDATYVICIDSEKVENNDVIIDLSGRIVTNPTKNGLLLINGKKVYITE